MLPLLSSALLAGLMGAPHCVGMCGGFAAATARTPLESLAWQTGRLMTYATLGALVGALGDRMPGPGWLPHAAAATFLILFSAQLAGWLKLPEAAIPGFARAASALLRRGGLASRFGFGMLTGLLPCGLVYAALGLALAAGSALGGAATMAVFGLGTAPALAFAAFGARKLIERLPNGRPIMAAAVLTLGLSALFIRAPSLSPSEHADLPTCHVQPE